MKKWTTLLSLTTICLAVLVNGRWPEARAQALSPQANSLSKETRAILDHNEKLILYSIDPNPVRQETDTRERFHRYAILGQTEIKDAKLKKELLSALYEGMDSGGGLFPSCFNPRHGIKAIEGTNSVDLLICFQCNQIVEYVGTSQTWWLKSERAEMLFNRTLKEGGVPLAKK